MTQFYFDRVARSCVVSVMLFSAGCAVVPENEHAVRKHPGSSRLVTSRIVAEASAPHGIDSQSFAAETDLHRASPNSFVEAPLPLNSQASIGESSAQDIVAGRILPASNTMLADSAKRANNIVAASNRVEPAQATDQASSSKFQPIPAAGTYSLTLWNVLQLADAQNPNVALARERINEAYARVDRAETLWVPSLRAGINYNHHEGSIQDVAGNVFNTNRSSFYGGMGAHAVGAGSPAVPGVVAQFHLTDAIFQPKIATHQAAASQFGATAARNDTLRDAAIAYLELVRAEHALAIALEATSNTEKLATLTRQYAESGQGLASDHQRLEAEFTLRQGDLLVRQEAVQVSSARLAQLLHADPSLIIVSGEPDVVPLDIMTVDDSAASYVATGLSRRPELAEQNHLVCQAVERLRREKYAPLVPSVLLGMSYGGMGGGLGSSIINSHDRWDADAVAVWEIRNLGFGERAARNETSSIHRQAEMRQMAVLDRVAREVTEAHAQVSQRQKRIELATRGVKAAEKSYELNIQRIENAQGLPIEVLQSIQALSTARQGYLNAVIDYNVSQFVLCHATGWFMDES